LGHVKKNHRAILDHGLKMRGAYLDVFAVVPPDECYNPEHPVTRAECLEYRGDCLDFVRSWGGVVSSEEPADWAVPHIDLVHHRPYALDPNPGQGPAMGIPVPLFNLVYHDALVLPWSLGRGAWGIPEKDLGFLHGLANAGIPYLSLSPSEEELAMVRTMCALHERVGLLELTNHAFLNGDHRRQEFTYADGTKIVIDLDKDQYEISPPLDIRSAAKDGILYAIVLAWPEKELTVRSLGAQQKLIQGEIAAVTLLGSGASLQWHRDEGTLLSDLIPDFPAAVHVNILLC
jgi:hypothetical protein